MTPTSTPGRGVANVLDETTRPVATPDTDVPAPSPQGQAVVEHFLGVHDRYRAQMRDVLDLLARVADGDTPVGDARNSLHELATRANDWMLGGYCQRQCLDLTEHHSIEDNGIFPHLRASDPALTPVLDRLEDEHHLIHDLLTRIDQSLIRLVSSNHDLDEITALLEQLDATISSHFAYEEEQLITPLHRFGFYRGQLSAP